MKLVGSYAPPINVGVVVVTEKPPARMSPGIENEPSENGVGVEVGGVEGLSDGRGIARPLEGTHGRGGISIPFRQGCSDHGGDFRCGRLFAVVLPDGGGGRAQFADGTRVLTGDS